MKTSHDNRSSQANARKTKGSVRSVRAAGPCVSKETNSKPELIGNHCVRHRRRSRSAIGWSAALRSPMSVHDLEHLNSSHRQRGEGDAHIPLQEQESYFSLALKAPPLSSLYEFFPWNIA